MKFGILLCTVNNHQSNVMTSPCLEEEEYQPSPAESEEGREVLQQKDATGDKPSEVQIIWPKSPIIWLLFRGDYERASHTLYGFLEGGPYIWHRGLAIHRDRSLQPRILVRIHLNLGRYHVYSMLHIAISQTQLYLALRMNNKEIPCFCSVGPYREIGKTSLECHTLYGFKIAEI
jgi:hypothetical protein